jgi:hypothetical protein
MAPHGVPLSCPPEQRRFHRAIVRPFLTWCVLVGRRLLFQCASSRGTLAPRRNSQQGCRRKRVCVPALSCPTDSSPPPRRNWICIAKQKLAFLPPAGPQHEPCQRLNGRTRFMAITATGVAIAGTNATRTGLSCKPWRQATMAEQSSEKRFRSSLFQKRSISEA